MNRPLRVLNSMSDDQLCEVVDLVSLLRVRDLIRECGQEKRRERLDPKTWERLLKLMPPPREEVRHEPVAGPRTNCGISSARRTETSLHLWRFRLPVALGESEPDHCSARAASPLLSTR
jgi:hypothetical protein